MQRDLPCKHRVAFLEDYDHASARRIILSVDVWMTCRAGNGSVRYQRTKSAINGGLNFSVLDGWWLEGYNAANGFSIGDLSD